MKRHYQDIITEIKKVTIARILIVMKRHYKDTIIEIKKFSVA